MFERARAKYLLAIGFPALTALACRTTQDASAVIGSTPGSAPSGSDSTTVPVAVDTPPPNDGGLRRPSFPPCPHGSFCTSDPGPADAAPAADPFSSCAQSRPVPEGSEAISTSRATVRFDPTATADKRATNPNACCYNWNILCMGGRALRIEGSVESAGAARRGDWRSTRHRESLGEAGRPLSAEQSRQCAAHWAREAAFEHASIATFARVSLELLAHGAPPELVAQAHAAALDEIEHARATYALASRYAGEPLGPGPFPAATHALLPRPLAALAVETLVDGCAGEAVAALALREAAAHAEGAELSAELLTIAEDEERHAELAWRTLRWALDVGGDAVRGRLLEEAEKLRISAIPARTHVADDPLASHGILGPDTKARIRSQAMAHVVLPCLHALLG